MKIFNNDKENLAVEKICQDKDIRKYFEKVCDSILALSIIALFYSIPAVIDSFKNNIDWIDKLVYSMFALFGIFGFVKSTANIAKIKKNK